MPEALLCPVPQSPLWTEGEGHWDILTVPTAAVSSQVTHPCPLPLGGVGSGVNCQQVGGPFARNPRCLTLAVGWPR